MSNIIERYVYDVVRRLPENQRDEVSRELQSNIHEMLSDNPSDKEIEAVLKSLGHPRKLASDYTEKKRYLISPEWFEDYITVLKVVAVILGSIAFIVALVESLFNPEASTYIGIFAEVLSETISSVISALFGAFAIVTIIFYILDKVSKGENAYKFDVKCLPRLPDIQKRDVSKFKTTMSIVLNITFGTLFIYLLSKNVAYLGWTSGDGFDSLLVPLFNDSVIKPFIAMFCVVIAINVSLDIFKLIEGQYTVRVSIFQTVVTIISTIVSIMVITTNNLLNTEFITELSRIVNVSISSFNEGFNIVVIVLTVLIVVGAVSEIGSLWSKLYKQKNKTIKNK